MLRAPHQTLSGLGEREKKGRRRQDAQHYYQVVKRQAMHKCQGYQFFKAILNSKLLSMYTNASNGSNSLTRCITFYQNQHGGMSITMGTNFLTSDMNVIMVLILDGNSEIVANVMSDLCYLISLKAFDHIESIDKLKFFHPKIPIFPHTCATWSELPSYISTMDVN